MLREVKDALAAIRELARNNDKSMNDFREGPTLRYRRYKILWLELRELVEVSI